MQYEFNCSLLDVIAGVVDNISRGNLSAANSELERVKSLIAKRNPTSWFVSRTRAPRVGQPLRNTSRMNSPTIQRTRKNSVQPREERSSRSGRRKSFRGRQPQPAYKCFKVRTARPLGEFFIIHFISTYLYRMTISVIVVTAINMGPVFTTQRTATTPGTSRPTLFE